LLLLGVAANMASLPSFVRHSVNGSTFWFMVFRNTGQKMHEPLNKPFVSDGGSELLRRVSGFFRGRFTLGSWWLSFHSSVIFVTFSMVHCITLLLLQINFCCNISVSIRRKRKSTFSCSLERSPCSLIEHFQCVALAWLADYTELLVRHVRWYIMVKFPRCIWWICCLKQLNEQNINTMNTDG